MGRVTRYVFGQLFVATILVTFTVTCAVWLTQSLRFIELIVNRGLSIGSYLYLTMMLLPSFLATLLPIGVFAAVLFTYNRLTTDSELIVMRAVGLGPVRLAWPAVVLAFVATVVNYGLTLYAMPLSYREFKDMESDVRSNYSALVLREGAFNTVSDGVTVYIREREADGGLRGIIIHDGRDKAKAVTIIAEHGVLAQTDDGERIIMVNGNRQVLERASGKISLLYFERYSADLGRTGTAGATQQRWRQPRERFLTELFDPGDSEMDRTNRYLLQAEGHTRLTSPLYPLVFTLVALGVLLPGDYNRRGQGRRILIAVLLMIVLQSGAVFWTGVAAKHASLIPAIYGNVLAPIAAALYWLLRTPRRRRVAEWGPAAAGAAG